MKMVVKYLNFVFHIEVKTKSNYKILNFVFQFLKNMKWHFGYTDCLILNPLAHKSIIIFGSNKCRHLRCSVKKVVLKNFAIFTGKHLCWSLFLIKFIKQRLQHRCFPVNISKFLRIPILKIIYGQLLLCFGYLKNLFTQRKSENPDSDSRYPLFPVKNRLIQVNYKVVSCLKSSGGVNVLYFYSEIL